MNVWIGAHLQEIALAEVTALTVCTKVTPLAGSSAGNPFARYAGSG